VNSIHKITIIGSGCVANAFAEVIYSKGYEIKEIVGRREMAVNTLAEKVHAKANLNDFSSMNKESDLYILAIKDDAIPLVCEELRLDKGILVHTSGSMEIQVLSKSSSQYGVLYPLQTFARERHLDFSKIPLFVLANNAEPEQMLFAFASMLSGKVAKMTDDTRTTIHLSAVFANNFTNFLLTQSKSIMDERQLDFQILKPLVEETVEKAFDIGPEFSQTGPAKRNDRNIIKKHLSMLNRDKKKLYSLISEMIRKGYNK